MSIRNHERDVYWTKYWLFLHIPEVHIYILKYTWRLFKSIQFFFSYFINVLLKFCLIYVIFTNMHLQKKISFKIKRVYMQICLEVISCFSGNFFSQMYKVYTNIVSGYIYMLNMKWSVETKNWNKKKKQP